MIYIDGACSGNPGVGSGAACFFAVKDSHLIKSDGESDDNLQSDISNSESSD